MVGPVARRARSSLANSVSRTLDATISCRRCASFSETDFETKLFLSLAISSTKSEKGFSVARRRSDLFRKAGHTAPRDRHELTKLRRSNSEQIKIGCRGYF